MKTIVKSLLLTTIFFTALALVSCKEKKGKLEVSKDGVEMEGKKGGSFELNDDGMKIEGKDGGKVEVNDEGVEIKKDK